MSAAAAAIAAAANLRTGIQKDIRTFFSGSPFSISSSGAEDDSSAQPGEADPSRLNEGPENAHPGPNHTHHRHATKQANPSSSSSSAAITRSNSGNASKRLSGGSTSTKRRSAHTTNHSTSERSQPTRVAKSMFYAFFMHRQPDVLPDFGLSSSPSRNPLLTAQALAHSNAQAAEGAASSSDESEAKRYDNNDDEDEELMEEDRGKENHPDQEGHHHPHHSSLPRPSPSRLERTYSRDSAGSVGSRGRRGSSIQQHQTESPRHHHHHTHAHKHHSPRAAHDEDVPRTVSIDSVGSSAHNHHRLHPTALPRSASHQTSPFKSPNKKEKRVDEVEAKIKAEFGAAAAPVSSTTALPSWVFTSASPLRKLSAAPAVEGHAAAHSSATEPAPKPEPADVSSSSSTPFPPSALFAPIAPPPPPPPLPPATNHRYVVQFDDETEVVSLDPNDETKDTSVEDRWHRLYPPYLSAGTRFAVLRNGVATMEGTILRHVPDGEPQPRYEVMWSDGQDSASQVTLAFHTEDIHWRCLTRRPLASGDRVAVLYDDSYFEGTVLHPDVGRKRRKTESQPGSGSSTSTGVKKVMWIPLTDRETRSSNKQKTTATAAAPIDSATAPPDSPDSSEDAPPSQLSRAHSLPSNHMIPDALFQSHHPVSKRTHIRVNGLLSEVSVNHIVPQHSHGHHSHHHHHGHHHKHPPGPKIGQVSSGRLIHLPGETPKVVVDAVHNSHHHPQSNKRTHPEGGSNSEDDALAEGGSTGIPSSPSIGDGPYPLIIGDVQPEQFECVQRIFEEEFDFLPRLLEHVIQRGNYGTHTVTAVWGGIVVAAAVLKWHHLRAQSDHPVLEIVLFATDRNYQGRGFGTLFNAALSEIARSAKVSKVTLRAAPRAHGFWLGVGYTDYKPSPKEISVMMNNNVEFGIRCQYMQRSFYGTEGILHTPAFRQALQKYSGVVTTVVDTITNRDWTAE